MKKKIIGIFVCMLLIATAVPAVTSIKNSAINATIPSTPQTSMTGDWTETQKLLASDGAANDTFGAMVTFDGDTALIGAWYDDDNGVILVLHTCSPALALPGHNKQSFLHQTAQQEMSLVSVFLLMVTLPSSEPFDDDDNGDMSGQHMYSPAPVPPGHNKQNSLHQTVQQEISLGFCFS